MTPARAILNDQLTRSALYEKLNELRVDADSVSIAIVLARHDLRTRRDPTARLNTALRRITELGEALAEAMAEHQRRKGGQ